MTNHISYLLFVIIFCKVPLLYGGFLGSEDLTLFHQPFGKKYPKKEKE